MQKSSQISPFNRYHVHYRRNVAAATCATALVTLVTLAATGLAAHYLFDYNLSISLAAAHGVAEVPIIVGLIALSFAKERKHEPVTFPTLQLDDDGYIDSFS